MIPSALIDTPDKWKRNSQQGGLSVQHCMVGAVKLCSGTNPIRDDILRMSVAAIWERFPERSVIAPTSARKLSYQELRRIIDGFNDHPDTTWDNVRSILSGVEATMGLQEIAPVGVVWND